MKKKLLFVGFILIVTCILVVSIYKVNNTNKELNKQKAPVEKNSNKNNMVPVIVDGLNIKIRKCEANLNYDSLTISKYKILDRPEKLFNEYFVAINTADWNKFEKLTVNFDDYCKSVKSTYEKRKELLLNAWRADYEGKRTFSLNYFVEYQGRFFLIMHSRYLHNGKYKGSPRPLPLIKKGDIFYFDANGFNAKEPIIHALLFTPFSEYDKILGKEIK